MKRIKNILWPTMLILTVISCKGQSTEPAKNNARLDECWTDSNGNHMIWYPDGFYSFTEGNIQHTYSAFGGGTYVYQPETGEFFVQITDLNQKQAISDSSKYEFRYKKYFSIIEENDSIIEIHTIPQKYEIDWKIDSTGRYHVIFTDTLEIDYWPVERIIYTRKKNINGQCTTIKGLQVTKDNQHYFLPGFDDFKNTWYSQQLLAMKEPVIYADSSQAETYRFTWLRTFHNPISIRIEKQQDIYLLTWKLCDGAGGYEPKQLIIDKQKQISETTWNNFKSLLSQCDFWNLETEEETHGRDGAQWILEGKIPGKYHVVDRWTPRGNIYAQCCDFLLQQTDLVIKKKDKY